MVETSCKRHIRRCRRKQPTPLRQKSCSRCVRGKTRCDLRQPFCSQCSERNQACIYPSVGTDDSANGAPEHPHKTSPDITGSWTSLPTFDGERTIAGDVDLTGLSETSLVSTKDAFPSTTSSFGLPENHDMSYRLQGPSSLSSFRFGSSNMVVHDPLLRTLPYWPCEPPDYDTPNLASQKALGEGDADPPKDKLSQIRDRWINPSFEPPSRTVPAQAVAAGFMTHVLKCYPKMMARDGRLPPMIHRLQSTSRTIPLVNCQAWTKIWEHRAGNDEAGLLNTMQVEFDRLFIEVRVPVLSDSILLIVQ